MRINISDIKKKTISVNQYVENLKLQFRDRFLEKKRDYRLEQETVSKIKKLAGKFIIVAFSAEWCKDCTENISVLALLSEATGIEVRLFGGLKTDPLNLKKKWRIPPSPPEVEVFNVDKIPLILVFDREGKEIGRIIEKPKHMPTLEQELYEIVKS